MELAVKAGTLFGQRHCFGLMGVFSPRRPADGLRRRERRPVRGSRVAARLWPEREPAFRTDRAPYQSFAAALQAEPARTKIQRQPPVSRVLYGGPGFPVPRDDHSSGRLSPAASCDQPGDGPETDEAFAFCRPIRSCSGGAAMPPALRASGALLRTFHPYRDERGGLLSVALSLGHPRTLSGACLREPTFLCREAAVIRRLALEA